MLKKISLLSIIVLLFSCKDNHATKFAEISGKITNHKGNNGKIENRAYSKEIKINKDGTFKDTLHIKTEGAMFSFTDGNEFTSLYLKNGDKIHLSLDTKEFDESIKYTGKGASNNNYIAQKSLLGEKLFTQNLFELGVDEFSQQVVTIKNEFSDLLKNTKDLDSVFVVLEKEELSLLEKDLTEQYSQLKIERDKFASFVGKPSPIFTSYENVNGKKTALKDLKGKFVYIDVWATWCGPCKAEIPSLKALEKQYHGKDIAFVSISVDNGRGYKDNSLTLAKQGWKDMIKEKDMKGVQLFADKAWKSDFIKAYGINGIPRFILLDKKGNVINADAPRPSSNSIKEILKKLKL